MPKPSSRRLRKIRRRRTPANNANKHQPVAPKVGNGESASYTDVPVTPSKVLMVEVDNVKHEPYKHTEEVKVPYTVFLQTGSYTHTHIYALL